MSRTLGNRSTAQSGDDSMDMKRCLKVSQQEYLNLRNLAVWASRRGNPELATRLFSAAANFATLFHSGFFIDPAAENELLKIGQSIDEYLPPELLISVKPFTKKRSLLHIVSEVSSVGGHCRTLIQWIKLDPDTQHSILVLRQRESQYIPWLEDQLSMTETMIITLDPDSSMLIRAMQVRHIARQGFSGCVNHIGQAESIPTIAFATDNCPPILLVDHADHSFWLGMAMTDIIIHQRPVGDLLCKIRRGGQSCFVLPIPLTSSMHESKPSDSDERSKFTERERVRDRFGIGKYQVMALTIGRRDKFRPMNQQNFFREAIRLTRNSPDVLLHVIGVERHQAESWAKEKTPAGQMVFHGEIPVDPDLRLAADIYLESYPFGSQTAFLESALAEIPAVRAPVETPLLATSDAAIDELIVVPGNEEQYWNQAKYLISHPEERSRIAMKIREKVVSIHTGDNWLDQLDKLYLQLDKTVHAPRSFSPDELAKWDNHDIALHRWHRWRDGEFAKDRMLRLTAKSLINSVMLQQQHISNWKLLPSLALRSLCSGRGDLTILQMGILSLLRKRKCS